MIGYHGSDEQITTLHGGIGMGIYLAHTTKIAAAYAPIVHTLHLADNARIADRWDVTEAIETARQPQCGSFDPAEYSPWALLEMTEVRRVLLDAGFDGAELADTSPDGDPHPATLVWNTDLLTITNVQEH